MDIARPLNCRFRVDQDDDELVLRRRTGSLAVGLFLVLWLSVWTVGVVFLTRDLIRQPSLLHVLWALPFWAAWIFASCLLLGSFLGFEQLRIGAHGIEHRSLFARRFVPLDEVMGIALDFRVVTSDRGRSKTTQPVLKIVATGKPLDVGQGVGDEELKWLGSLIQEHIQSLIPQRTLEHRLKTSLKSSPRIEVLSPESRVPKPPSDCSIERVDDRDGTTFVRRGQFRFTDLAGITLSCMFWNGIVGIFVLQLIEEFQWFLFLFMIPHEVIGLLILAGWLATSAVPSGPSGG